MLDALGSLFGGAPLEPVAARATVGSEESGLGASAFAVRQFQLREGIDRPFELVLDLVTPALDLELEGLVAQTVEVEVSRPGHGERVIRGVATRCEYVRTFDELLHIRLLVEPALALLRYSRRRRIFQGLSVPEIVARVVKKTLTNKECELVTDKLRREYPQRDHCVQYDETDLEFVLRLLGEEGIGIAFAGQANALVLFDDNSVLLPAGHCLLEGAGGDADPIPVIPDRFETARAQSVQYLGRSHGMRPRKWTAMAFDWKSQPVENLLSSVSYGEASDTVGQVFTFSPHRLDEGTDALQPHLDATLAWADRRAEDARARQTRAPGASNITGLAAGSTLEVTHHPHAELDGRYVVVEAVHWGDFPEVEPEAAAKGEAQATYRNEFVAQPLDVPLRPPLPRRKRAAGPASGIVVGPEGEEIHTDDLGRVKVRMHWDEQAAGPVWMRVLHSWAGAGFGTLFVPRVGMEVIVDFLDGNPDRPVVTGCAYNRQNLPPVMLPEQKTKTVIARSRSVPSKDGFNELTFEDATGKEEVFLHAERNLREVVKASHCTSVGGEQSNTVGGDRNHAVRGSEIVTVEKDRHLRVEGVFGTHVVGSEATYVGGGGPKGEGDPGVTTGASELRVDGRRYVWARDEILLEVGDNGSSIRITPDEIILTSRSVKVLAGPEGAPTTTLSLLPDLAHLGSPATVLDGFGGGRLSLDSGGAILHGNATAVVEAPATSIVAAGKLTTQSALFEATAQVMALQVATTCTVSAAAISLTAGNSIDISGGTQTTCAGGEAFVRLAGGIVDLNG